MRSKLQALSNVELVRHYTACAYMVCQKPDSKTANRNMDKAVAEVARRLGCDPKELEF